LVFFDCKDFPLETWSFLGKFDEKADWLFDYSCFIFKSCSDIEGIFLKEISFPEPHPPTLLDSDLVCSKETKKEQKKIKIYWVLFCHHNWNICVKILNFLIILFIFLFFCPILVIRLQIRSEYLSSLFSYQQTHQWVAQSHLILVFPCLLQNFPNPTKWRVCLFSLLPDADRINLLRSSSYLS